MQSPNIKRPQLAGMLILYYQESSFPLLPQQSIALFLTCRLGHNFSIKDFTAVSLFSYTAVVEI